MKNRADHIHIIIKSLENNKSCDGIIIRFKAEYKNEEVELYTYLTNSLLARFITDLGQILAHNLLELENEEEWKTLLFFV